MKLGFIGTGNMASAIMGGIIKNNVIPAEEIIGADLFAPGRERAQKEYGINVTADNKEVAQKAIPDCSIVFIEGDEMKTMLSGYLATLDDQNPEIIGGQLPDDAFYYKR